MKYERQPYGGKRTEKRAKDRRKTNAVKRMIDRSGNHNRDGLSRNAIHFYRAGALLLCLILLLGAAPVTAMAPGADEQEWEVLRLTNEERLAAGLQPLSMTSALQGVTTVRAAEIATVFDHTRPNGLDCFSLLEQDNVPYLTAGENIAVGYITPADVTEAWMNSPGHRANILKTDFSHLGVGYLMNRNYTYRFHYAQMFTGGCSTEAISVNAPNGYLHVNAGSAIADWDLTLTASCSCGKGYLPLPAGLCSGYDPTKIGAQGVSVSYRGKQLRFTIYNEFRDVNAGAWFAPAVHIVYDAGLFQGVTDIDFAPGNTMSRAMLVTVLYRLAGTPQASASTDFYDVPDQSWYTAAVSWAQENDVVNGTDTNHFSPALSISRQDIAVMLYRYASNSGEDLSATGDLSVFADQNEISPYAETALRWAVGKGLINGQPQNRIAPTAFASRAEVAVILSRYMD